MGLRVTLAKIKIKEVIAKKSFHRVTLSIGKT
jgi:hypothetical protein